MQHIRRVVIHHSASPANTTVDQIRSWHMARGMYTIAYHYVLASNGFLHHGRLLPQMGAHAKGANVDSIGICFIGDFTKQPEGPTAAQRTTFRALRGALDLIWPGLVYLPHREAGTTPTECPGFDISTLK